VDFLASLFGITLLGIVSFLFIEDAGGEKTIENGIVLEKKHDDGYYNAVSISDMTAQNWVPESWSIVVKMRTENIECDVSEKQYASMSPGQGRRVEANHGLITGKLYCNKVLPE
jgi:hypothetical protein